MNAVVWHHGLVGDGLLHPVCGRQRGDQSQLFYLFNLEERIPRKINPTVTRVLADLREKLAPFDFSSLDWRLMADSCRVPWIAKPDTLVQRQQGGAQLVALWESLAD